MKKILILTVLILLVSMTYLIFKESEDTHLQEVKKTSTNMVPIKTKISIKEKHNILEKQLKEEKVRKNTLNKVGNASNIKTSKKYDNNNFVSIFNSEVVDQEWSYEYANNIRETLHELLPSQDAWVDNLECRTTLCLLDVYRDKSSSQSFRATANIMKKLSSSKWNKGDMTLRSVGNEGDLQVIKIIISRNANAFH